MNGFADTLRATTFTGTDIASLIETGLITHSYINTNSTKIGPLSSTTAAQVTGTDVTVSVASTNSIVVIQGAIACSAATGKYGIFQIADTAAPTTALTNCHRSIFSSAATDTTGYQFNIPVSAIVTSPSVGSHTYRIIYTGDAGGSAAIYSDSRSLYVWVFRLA